mmetsp:Transcript_159917/g.298290  ORF Transcript_159917/g.298290 Transcript_159917/m.298290 type:complete len:203 (-) Transcript_159917:75-683(-)
MQKVLLLLACLSCMSHSRRVQVPKDAAPSSDSLSPLARLLLASGSPAAAWQVPVSSPQGIRAGSHKATSTRMGSRLAGVSMSDTDAPETAVEVTEEMKADATEAAKPPTQLWADESTPGYELEGGEVWPVPRAERTNYNVGVTLQEDELDVPKFAGYVGFPIFTLLLQLGITVSREFFEGDGPADMTLELVLRFLGIEWVVP